MPKRIQRKRTKGWRMPPGAVYVGRPTRWGNPWHAVMYRDFSAENAVGLFRRWIKGDLSLRSAGEPPPAKTIREELGGKDLCCWCPPDQPCHADVLLEIANQ